jgi:hypothetical protein
MLKEGVELKTKFRHVYIYNMITGRGKGPTAQEGHVAIKWVSTRKMPADGLTKLLSTTEV